jgi:hypothetical protein
MEKLWSVRKIKFLKPLWIKDFDFGSNILWRSLLIKTSILGLVSHFNLLLGQFFLKPLLNGYHRLQIIWLPITVSRTVLIKKSLSDQNFPSAKQTPCSQREKQRDQTRQRFHLLLTRDFYKTLHQVKFRTYLLLTPIYVSMKSKQWWK